MARDIEKQRETNRKWREKNKERLQQKERERYLKLKEKPEFMAKRAEQARNQWLKAEKSVPHLVSQMLSAAKSRAKKYGFDFNIEKKDIENLLEKYNWTCQATGHKLTSKFNDPYKVSLDRINSNKGYVKGNIRIVATAFNYMKNEYTDRQFYKIAKSFVEMYEAKRCK